MTDTEILRMFREYYALRTARHVYSGKVYNDPVFHDEDVEHELLYLGPADRLRDEMMILPATCMADLAAKMIAAHLEGNASCLDWDTDPVWVEARKLVGIDQDATQAA